MKRFPWTLACFALLAFGALAQNAQAHGGIRIGIGLPLYIGPRPYYYGHPYYYYPPAYAVPAPLIYHAPPPTVIVRPAAVVTEVAPAPAPYTAASPPASLPPVTNVTPVSNQSSPQIDALLRQLADSSETVRRDAAVQLGRLKASNAVDALTGVLAKDASPVARDGAARALGLIAAPHSLKALIYAAQADDDREVRRSAQFAVEVIRSNLRGN